MIRDERENSEMLVKQGLLTIMLNPITRMDCTQQ
jgi:hypothetical protein